MGNPCERFQEDISTVRLENKRYYCPQCGERLEEHQSRLGEVLDGEISKRKRPKEEDNSNAR